MKASLIKNDILGKLESSIEVSPHQVYLTLNKQLKSGWFRNASSKNRSAVSGGGAKPYRQKGTGRARRGTQRSPLIVGGGVTFGPNPHFKSYKLNKKQSRVAITSVLKSIVSSGNSTLIDYDADSADLKSRDFRELFSKKSESVVFITADDIALFTAIKNFPNVRLLFVDSFELQSLVGVKDFFFSSASLQLLISEFKNA